MSIDNPDIEIVPATGKEDLLQIRKLAESIWPATFDSILSKPQIGYMLQMMYDPKMIADEISKGISYFFVKDAGIPVGYLSFGPYEKNCMKLHKCYLSAPYQGKGIGSMMLNFAIEQARKSGADALRLNVNKQNDRAIKAYLRNGFETVEKVKGDIGNGFFMDDFVMEKKINQPNKE